MGFLRRRPPKVEKLRRKNDVDGLTRALSYHDEVVDKAGTRLDPGSKVRTDAVVALGELDEPTAIAAVAQSLDDTAESVRTAAIDVLAAGPREVAVTELLRVVVAWTDDEHEASRSQAVAVLGKVADPTVPERLAVALVEREPGPVEADREILTGLLASCPDQDEAEQRVVGRMLDMVGADQADTGTRAAEILTWMGPESVERLVASVHEGDVRRRQRVVEVLGQSRDIRAVPELERVLESDDDGLRKAAVVALGDIRDPSAVESLLRMSGDAVFDVRVAASDALDKLGTVAVILGVTALVRPALPTGASAPDVEQAVERGLNRVLESPPPAAAEPEPPPAAPPAGGHGQGDRPVSGWLRERFGR